MKRISFIAAALLATFSLGTALKAQTAKDLIIQNPERAANVYHNYEVPEISGTPAPKGYAPFYISHYGRHGSRYHTKSAYFSPGLDVLRAAAEAGILTTRGEELHKDYELLVSAHEGMYGTLTQKGGKTLEGLAKRMYGRFPQVFGSDGRKIVNCTASIIPRCILSMDFFSSALSTLTPREEFHFYSSERSMKFIAHDIDMGNTFKINEKASDSLRAVLFNPERMMNLFFTDTAKAAKMMNGDLQKFFKSVFLAGSIAQDMDAPYDKIDIFGFFNSDELYAQWLPYNAMMYENHCNSKEYGDYRSKAAANLLEDITEKADSAIANGKVAADLRFGHDTGLLPLINLIKLKGQDKYYSLEEASEHWFGFETMPMGANIQFVFYSNPKEKGRQLVKILYNEKETVIPSLKTCSGPYYEWSDLRSYFKAIYEPIAKTESDGKLPRNSE